MLSPSDTVIIFFVALLLFGPEHLPKIAKQLGDAMRHVQSTTSAFMAEMDRAAAAAEHKATQSWQSPASEPAAQTTEISAAPATELPVASTTDALTPPEATSSATETRAATSAGDEDIALPGTMQRPEEPEWEPPDGEAPPARA